MARNKTKRALLIGITGSIGSGKSTVSKLIEEHYKVISADLIANDILDSEPYISIIKKKWGKSVLRNGFANRTAIAEIVFENLHELKFLNDLLHPPVLKRFQEIVDSRNDSFLFFEVPLLFEIDLRDCFDYIVLVTADPDIRVIRLIQRSGQSEAEILARMASQMDDNLKAEHSDLVIYNNSDLRNLRIVVTKWLRTIPQIEYRIIRAFA